MTIKEQVTEQMKTAMKAHDKERLGVIRLILADFKRVEVDERIVLDETRELTILDKMLKQRRDSFSQFKAAGRDDLADKEQFEIEVIQSFMPKPLSEEEVKQVIKAAIQETGAASVQDMGKVMAIVKPKLQGKADIGQVGAQIKSLLSASSH
jgi:uncharacterized protein